MNKIAIFGSGGFGREVLMLIDQINKEKKQWEFIGFFDDGKEIGSNVNGYSILGGTLELNNYISSDLYLVVAIGNPYIKRKIIGNLNNSKIKFATLIHPSVSIQNYGLSIGYGCIITSGVILTVNIEIGNHVILNLGCTVGHDTKIGDFCSFMPSVNISGEVIIEEGVYVGTGAKIINLLTIGEWTTVGAGALVVKSLPSNCTAIGIPAKPMKFHE